MALQRERFDDDRILEAVEKATKVYNICANRVWAMVENSAGKEQELHTLFPPTDYRLDRLFCHGKDQRAVGRENTHDRCTFDFCEQSLVNSTSVEQRHESRSCTAISCEPIAHVDIFPAAVLNKAVKEQRPTAWHLYGRRITQPHHKYMAISHVWSDGTGAGKGDGKVNKCLFDFFRDIAFQLECEGIWWDTLCIPSDSTARALAVQNMHNNYEHAEVTLVHDCFLRNLPWIDAETACLAIILSPWFSRGWTALELAKSRTVKILFKGERGFVLKDLNNDILYNPQTVRHRTASSIIHRLRTQSIKGVDDLLCVLRSRYTSWTKDMAVISALLVGVSVGPEDEEIASPSEEKATTGSAKNVYQQEIFEKIVKHLGIVEYGHLFHNLPTMCEGASWCPARFLELPLSFSEDANLVSSIEAVSRPNSSSQLRVDAVGDIVGIWNVFPASCASPEHCDWRGVPPLIAAKIRSSLKKVTSHRILVEPFAKLVVRFLVVKVLATPFASNTYQFIGSVHCEQPQDFDENLGVTREISIVHRLDKQRSRKPATKLGVFQVSEELSQPRVPQMEESDEDECSKLPSHQSPDALAVYKTLYVDSNEQFRPAKPPRRWRETPWDQDLLLAVKEGRESDVLRLLRQGADPNCHDEDLRTPMSWAAKEGHEKIVRIIIDHHRARLHGVEQLDSFDHWNPEISISIIDDISQRFLYQVDSQDKDGWTPLAWAAANGHTGIVYQLILWCEINIDSIEVHGWTPLAFAVAGGHAVAAKLLLDAGASTDIIVGGQLSLLGLAARAGIMSTTRLLLDSDAQVEGLPPINLPLVLAAESGKRRVIKLLIDRGAKSDLANHGGTALYMAAAGGHAAALKLLLEEKGKFDVNKCEMPQQYGDTALVAAVSGGKSWSPFLWSPFSSSSRDTARRDYEEVVRLLLDTRAFDVNTKATEGDGSTPLHIAASRGYEKVLKLLLNTGQAKVDVQNKKGMTPLWYAARHGHENIVRMLLEAGASANIKCHGDADILARTPMSIARDYGHDVVFETLKPCTNISNRLWESVEKFSAGLEGRERREMLREKRRVHDDAW